MPNRKVLNGSGNAAFGLFTSASSMCYTRELTGTEASERKEISAARDGNRRSGDVA